jgi:putative ABC transport system permease protein
VAIDDRCGQLRAEARLTMSLLSRVANAFRSGRLERTLDEELAFHIESRTDDLVAGGMSRDVAEATARRQFGSPLRVREASRDVKLLPWLESRIRDVRHALRALRSAPTVTAVAIITLALGIGANTAVFSVVNAVLLRPLPYKDGNRLVWLWSTDPKNPTAQWMSHLDVVDIRAQSRSLAELAAWYGYEMVLTGNAEPQRVQVVVVFGDLFATLGVPPVLGTTFRAEKGAASERAIVLSHRFWVEKYGADLNIVGRGLTLSGKSYRVLGVMPSGFRFPIQTPPIDMWASLGSEQFADVPQMGRNARLMDVIGRLRDDVAIERAQAELDVVAARLSQQYPDSNTGIGLRVVSAAEHVVGRVSRPLLVLFAAVGCVLLIACVNVANLLLARATDRRREIALRSALGAGRARIVGQLVIESLVLASIGGAIGGLIAIWGVDALVALVPGDLPRADEIGVDRFVLVFTVLASLVTGLAFGVAPAWHASKVDLTVALQEDGRTLADSARAPRLRGALVVAEIALAVMLLTGATLFVTTFWRLQQPSHGYDPRNVLTFDVTWPWEKYSVEQSGVKFRELQTALQAVPGVRGAAAGLQLPDRGGPATEAIFPYLDIEGRPVPSDSRPRTASITSQPGFFRTLGIPLVKGRDFSDRDSLDAPRVAIINESLARTYFGSENPIGRRLKLDLRLLFGDETPMREIVGVVADVTHAGLTRGARTVVYIPFAQRPFNMSYLVVKTDGDPARFVSSIRAAVRSVDKDQPIYDVKTLEERIGMSVGQERFVALLLASFSAVALLLAAIGLYGVLSYSVAQRTHEMGIRLALGAEANDVIGLVVRHGLKLIAVGLVIGIAGAIAVAGLIEGLLFGVSALDPRMHLVVVIVLAVVAIAACWIPARRAARVDPIVALRYQ